MKTLPTVTGRKFFLYLSLTIVVLVITNLKWYGAVIVEDIAGEGKASTCDYGNPTVDDPNCLDRFIEEPGLQIDTDIHNVEDQNSVSPSFTEVPEPQADTDTHNVEDQDNKSVTEEPGSQVDTDTHNVEDHDIIPPTEVPKPQVDTETDNVKVKDEDKKSVTEEKTNTSEDVLDDIPIIVWWTSFLYYHKEEFRKLESCPKSTCYVTKQRKYLTHPQTNVLFFYGTDFDPENLPLPREQRHLWSVLHEESPLNNAVINQAVTMSLFNYTAAMQRDADFPLSTLSFPGAEFMMNREPVSTADKNMYQKTENLAPVVYVQSHCEVPSDRDRYVQELMQYIKVDSYGKCLHNKDFEEAEKGASTLNMFNTKFKDVMGRYKFILAFENGFCNDYMTEKLFRPLHVGSIPVYRGSPLARDFMPDNHSIIMTDDFESPKELAEFLLKLNENDEEYEKYLEFKKRKTIINPELKHQISRRKWPFRDTDHGYGPFVESYVCDICDKATERYNSEKKHKKDPSIPLMEPKITDGKKFACPRPVPFSKPDESDWWYRVNYEGLHLEAQYEAQAMRDMIQAGESNSTNFKSYLKKVKKST